MKAFLCVGFILLGMVATEGVVTQEYECDETFYADPYDEMDVEDEDQTWCEADLLFAEGEAEALVCLDENEPLGGSGF